MVKFRQRDSSGVKKTILALIGVLSVIQVNGFLKVLVLLGSAMVVYGQLTSPRLTKLRGQAGNSDALNEFWREVQRSGTPMIEEVAGTEDVLVTFLLRSDSTLENPVVFASVLPNNNTEEQRLSRIAGTDVWFRTYRFHRDVPILYELSIDGPQKLQRDPMNSQFIEGPTGGSVVMPRGSSLWNASTHSQRVGKVEELKFHSKLLSNDRTVAVYLPPDFITGHAHHLVVVLDEDVFNGPVKLPRILDDLIASRKLRPPIVAMVGNVDRKRELSCSSAFSEMLGEELVPWIRDRFQTQDRGRATIAGSSLGGLAAACAGFQASKTFDSVIALSGSFRWRPDWDQEPEWLTRQIAAAPPVPVRFFLGVGSFETGVPNEPGNLSLLTATRHLRDVLQARGYRFMYREFPGAHEPLSWSLNIGDALAAGEGISKRKE